MQIRIRADNSVEIEGYVNAVERDSRILQDRTGKFVERIRAGAFKRTLERNRNVDVLLNHKENRKLASIADTTAELTEDPIGLKCRCVVTDSEVVEKARAGKLRGWSFGYIDMPNGVDVSNYNEDGSIKRRDVRDLNMMEVSIIDDTMTPCFAGTLINVRADESIYTSDVLETDIKIIDVEKKERAEDNIDYSEYEDTIQKLKTTGGRE